MAKIKSIPFPFFPYSHLFSSYTVMRKTGARIIVVSGHCETCHKQVNNIIPVLKSQDARFHFVRFFESLTDGCTKPLEFELE